jgi:hypothetical protein
VLNCYEADTGKVVYRFHLDAKSIRERSQTVADGKVYICTDRKIMKVLRAGRTPTLLAESKLRKTAATVEAIDGCILVAEADRLTLYGSRAARQTGETVAQQEPAGSECLGEAPPPAERPAPSVPAPVDKGFARAGEEWPHPPRRRRMASVARTGAERPVPACPATDARLIVRRLEQ